MRKLIAAALIVGMLAVFFAGCIWDSNKSPEAKIDISPQGVVNTGQTVIFSGNGSSDPDGSIKSYSWDLGDGTKANSSWLSHVYRINGAKTVTLTVVDDKDATGEASTLITVNGIPTASVNLVPTPRTYTNLTGNFYNAYQTIKFDASGSSDPEGGNLTYLWNFGDQYHSLNNTNDQKISYHQYTVGGNYTVNLKVSDGYANVNYSITLTVQDLFFEAQNFTYYKDMNGYRFVNFTAKIRNDGDIDKVIGSASIIVQAFGVGGTQIPGGFKNTSNSFILPAGSTKNIFININDVPISLSSTTTVRAAIYWNNILMDEKITIIPP